MSARTRPRDCDEVVEGLKYPTRRSVFTLKPDGSLDRDFNAVTIELSDYAPF